MTLVCVRLDNSSGFTRIAALADTRATIKRKDGSIRTLSDTTRKLFALPVRCYTLDSLSLPNGAWTDPYHETTIGIGFAGSCFEALTIIAHVDRMLSTLISPDGDPLIQSAHGLTHLVFRFIESYFRQHSGAESPTVSLLIFGFENDTPWIGRISYNSVEGARYCMEAVDNSSLATIGQGALFEQYAGEWRRRIEKHRNSLRSKPVAATSDAAFDHSLKLARDDMAEKKIAEEVFLEQIDSEFVDGIGGVLQKLELSYCDGKVLAAFTADDRIYLRGSTYSTTLEGFLGPIPIIEQMGRRTRQAD